MGSVKGAGLEGQVTLDFGGLGSLGRGGGEDPSAWRGPKARGGTWVWRWEHAGWRGCSGSVDGERRGQHLLHPDLPWVPLGLWSQGWALEVREEKKRGRAGGLEQHRARRLSMLGGGDGGGRPYNWGSGQE